MRRRLDLLSPLVTALDLLEKDNVRILFAQKGDRACKTHLGLVRILFIPNLAILHVESQRAEHRFPVACDARRQPVYSSASGQGSNTMHKVLLIRHGESAWTMKIHLLKMPPHLTRPLPN